MINGARLPIDRRNPGEQGMALITVLLALMALLALSATAVAYGVGSQTLSRRDQDWNAALAAAEAGVDDFVFRLNENSNYFLYNSTNAPPDGNKAFIQYVSVPGGNTISQFRYSTDTSRLAVDGTILISSTGRVGTTRRTVQSTLRRRTFLDYLYYTDYETLDPALYTGPLFTGDTTYTPTQASTSCTTYAYATPGRGSGCVEINFITADAGERPPAQQRLVPRLRAAALQRQHVDELEQADPAPIPNQLGLLGEQLRSSPTPVIRCTSRLSPCRRATRRSRPRRRPGRAAVSSPARPPSRSTPSGTMTVTSPFSKQVNGSCVKNGTGALPDAMASCTCRACRRRRRTRTTRRVARTATRATRSRRPS